MSEHATQQYFSSPRVRHVAADIALLTLDQPLGAYLESVMRAAVRGVPGMDAGSILVMQTGQVKASVATSPAVARLEQRTQEVGYGPSLDAARSGAPVCLDLEEGGLPWYSHLVDDGQSAVRVIASYPFEVPRYGTPPPPAHSALGTDQAAASVPSTSATPGGRSRPRRRALAGPSRAVCTFYSSRAVPAEMLALAHEVTRTATATAIANAVLHDAAVLRSDQLQDAMDRRSIIEQAKGALMATGQVNAEQAFHQLRVASRNGNIKVVDLATDLVLKAATGDLAEWPPAPRAHPPSRSTTT